MVVIQQVIVMSSQTLAQSDKAAAPPNEAEYNAVYAAVTATERGRWFLKEFANRNRSADTDLIMAAIARIEAAIAGGAAPQAAQVREQVRDLALAATVIEPARPAVGERDDDAAAVSAQTAPAATDGVSQPQAQSDEDYSEAVAAIAASLTVRLDESVKELAAESAIAQSVNQADATGEAARVPQQAPSVLAASATARPQMTAAQSRVVQDNTTRWHIEGPDFVFGADDSGGNSPGAAPAGPSPQMHAQLLGAELMATELVDVAESAPVVDPVLGPVLDSVPLPAVTETPTAETISALAAPMLDVAPPSEILRPQLRIARETMPANQRPLRYGSLTVSDALSEDEVIALFG
jgi:hypothetical protein